jgi:hypothetical protein
MVPRLRTAPIAALLAVAVLSAPAASEAASAPVKGQVVGSPYLADASRTAVPVLLSKETARKAKLSSPLGVVIVPRRTAVKMPGGTVLPGRLRLGDKFSGTASVTKEARSATYPRMTFKGMTVTKRSKQLSTQELEEQLAKTRKDVAGLTTFVNQLAGYTQRGFTDLTGRVTTLTGDLAATKADLASVKTQVTKVAADLSTATADLRGRIDLVRSDLQPQITDVVDDLSALTSVIGACGTPGTVLDKICSLETIVGNLNPANLGPLTDRVTQISGALTGLVNQLTGLSLVGDLPATLTGQITSLLTNLSGLSGTVTGLTGQVGGLNTTVSSLSSGLSTVTGLVGGINVGALNTTVSGITGQITGLLATDAITAGSLSSLQTSLTGALSQVTGILGYLSPGDSNLATTADNTLNIATSQLATLTGTTLPLIQSQLNTVCTTWRTTLSGATAPVFNLLAILTGSATLPVLPGC